MRMYKLRNKKSGKFAEGGLYVSEHHCDDNGEIFTEKDLQDYLTDMEEMYGVGVYSGYEVVVYECTEAEVTTIAAIRKAAKQRYKAEQAEENKKIEEEQLSTFGETF